MLSAEKLAERKLGLGGSDAAPAIGVETFGRNRITLWKEKTGRADRPDISGERRIRRGTFLEEYIAREYSIETGMRVRRRNQAIVHPKYPFMHAHIDRQIVGVKRVLECKSVHPLATHGWGASGTDEVPMAYLCQAAHYIAVMNAEACDLAALFGDELKIYVIPRNLELEQAIIEFEADFWGYVERDEPPPPKTVSEVLDLYPRDAGQIATADGAIEAAWYELLAVRQTLKSVESEKDRLEEIIKVFIADRADLAMPNGYTMATWRAAKDSHRIDWKAIAEQFLAECDPARRDELTVEHTNIVAGSRRFILKEPRR